jgi:hypothetical protein
MAEALIVREAGPDETSILSSCDSVRLALKNGATETSVTYS